jgi:molecular chaperone DnaJ
MGPKDYYLILGVSRSETPEGIRARYRDLVRMLHPDVAGAQSTNAFREVTEAYQVLADPAARRRHNIVLAESEHPAVAAEPFPETSWRATPPVSPFAEPLTVRPSFDTLVELLLRNVTGLGIPKAERPKPVTIEIVLEPQEAVLGVRVPVSVPVVERCPRCGGAGDVWGVACMLCRQHGVIEIERVVDITIPPWIRHGAVLDLPLPLHGFGIRNLYLRCRVQIAA